MLIDIDPNAPHDEDCGFWSGFACVCKPEMRAALERDHCHECDHLHGSGYNRCNCLGFCICDREADCPCVAEGIERRLAIVFDPAPPCGCGELAPISKKTRTRQGHTKGQPMRFIHGHQNVGREMPPAHREAIRVATTIFTPGRGIAEGWWWPNVSGLCECGCGGKTPLAQQTSRRFGHMKGYPTRWISGHWSRGRKMPPKSAETRAKLSAALRGKPKPPGYSERVSAARKGRKMPPRRPEHMAKISAALKGRNHGRVGEKAGNWRGGITPIHLAARATPEYKEWRTAVFERDGYACQYCGGGSGSLHAHHIKPFATHPELRTVLENGVTLCQTCHTTIPKRSIKETK